MLKAAAAAAGIFVIVGGGSSVLAAYGHHVNKSIQHDSKLSGQEWLDELLNGHSGRFYNELGMHKHVFQRLLKVLEREVGFHNSKHITASEQLAIFLHFARRALSNRALQERFQHSGDTISKIIHRVLDALTSHRFYPLYVKLPTRDEPVPHEIQSSKNLYPFFKDCLGALDGTHIAAFPPEHFRPAYRNRKGQISQNVLAVCSMDMRFLYVLPGWEGSASDSRVYEDARSSDFLVPPGKYYLADAGYGTCDALLVPYRGVTYHLKEWGKRSDRPSNYEELFNLRHAQARNIIERVFGVCKKRFKVLIVPQEYSLRSQAQLVSALAVIHNFIRIHDPDDLPEEEDDEDVDDDRDIGTLQGNITLTERERAVERRDTIAKAMWADYERRGRRRG